jgi:wyosine [tRNA(Phe)-imidazoG37] synthetase (radical SAM superfamily)
LSVLPLEQGIVYGPLRSRRLGISLGVNLLPTRYKVCSFDCVYCHYGRTPQATTRPRVQDMPWPDDVVRAVEAALQRYRSIDFITFSGNGEPTLHPAFPEIADRVRALRDRYRPSVRLALFSNASTLGRPDVVESLRHFDAPMMKLDAGDADTFRAIDRPAVDLQWEAIVAGLQAAGAIHTQSVLIGGPATNATGPALDAWMRALNAIRPARVHIYSTEYPVAEAGVARIPPFELERIAQELARRTGLQVDARWHRL